MACKPSRPALAGYTFAPTNIAVTVSGADKRNQNFTASTVVPTNTISGQITGAVSGSISVTLCGQQTGQTYTDGRGNYSVTGRPAGNYTVTPTLAGYTFSPASIAVVLLKANYPGHNLTWSSEVVTPQENNSFLTRLSGFLKN